MKSPGRSLCIIFLLLLSLPVFGGEFFEPIQPARPFQVMAHRGAMNLAPENTSPALEHCIKAGFEWAEVDVRLTRDGRHVLFHDDQVDGKTNGTGRVRELSLAELKALDAGAWFSPRFAGERILTLGECLALCKDRLNLYLDCKDIDSALLVQEVLAAGMERQVVVFDELEVLAKVRASSGGRVPIMPKWHPEFGHAEWVAKWRPDAVEINAGEVTPEICTWFHAQGIKVQAKVLGDDDRPEVWERMRAAGVDWFQTDQSEKLLRHLLPPPAPDAP